MARLKEAQTQLEMLDRQIATKQAEEKGLRSVDCRVPGACRGDAGPRVRDDRPHARLRDATTRPTRACCRKAEDSKVAANMERRRDRRAVPHCSTRRGVPEKPVSPNRPLINLLGALAGLAVGFGFVALLEYRDDSFRTDDEVVSVLALPVVAVIPVMLNRSERDRLRRRSMLIASADGRVHPRRRRRRRVVALEVRVLAGRQPDSVIHCLSAFALRATAGQAAYCLLPTAYCLYCLLVTIDCLNVRTVLRPP